MSYFYQFVIQMVLFIFALILQLHSSYIAFYYIIQAKYPEMQKLLRSSYKPEDNQQYMHAYSNNKNKKPNRLNSRQKSKEAYAKKFFERRNALQMQVRQKIIKQKKQGNKKVENKTKMGKPRRKNQQLQHSIGSNQYGQNKHQLQITDYKHNYYGVDIAKCNKNQRVQERWVRGREDANCQKDSTTKTTKTKQGLKFEREKQIKHDPILQKLILKNNMQSKFCKLLMKANFTEHQYEPGPYINVSNKYKEGCKQKRPNRFLNSVTNPEQNSSVQLKKEFQFDFKSKYLDQNMEIGKTLNSNNVRGYRNNEFEQEMRGRSKTTKCEIDEKLRSKLAMIILNQREKARQRDNTNQHKKKTPNVKQFSQQQSFKQQLDLIINESSSKSVSQHDSSISDVKIVNLRRSQQNQGNNYFNFEQKIKQITEQNKIGRIQKICNNRRLVDFKEKEEEEQQKYDEQDKQSDNMYPFLDSWLKNPQKLRQKWTQENHLAITQNRYNNNPLTLLRRQDQKIQKGRQRQKQENSYSVWSFDNQFEEVEMIQDNVCEQLNIQIVRKNREQSMLKHQDKNEGEQQKQQHSQMICAICQTNIPHNLWKFAIFYSKSKMNSQQEYYNFYEIFHNQQQENGQTQENNSHEVPMLLHCGHSYHRMCLQEWFNYKTVCPLCKAEHDNDNNRDEQSDNMISFSYESNSDEDVDFEFLPNGADDENLDRYNHIALSSSQTSHRNLSQQNRYNIQMRNYLQQSQQVEYSLNQYSALLQTYQARINEQIQQSRERAQNALNNQQQHNNNSLLPSPPLSQFQINQISYDVNLAEQSSFSSIHMNADLDIQNLPGRIQRVEGNERQAQLKRFADEQSQQQL